MVQVHVEHADPASTVPVPTADEKRKQMIGHYQGITVDLETGRFFFDPEDWRQDYRVTREQRRGVSWFPGSDWQPVHRYVRWMLDSGIDVDKSMDPPCPFPYIDVEQANALLDELAPVVQKFADAMTPIPGRPGLWDWTRTAVAVGRAIHNRVQRAQTPVPEVIEPDEWHRDITELADRYEHFDIVMAKWFSADHVDRLSDKQIRNFAADFGRGFVDARFPGVLKTFGLDGNDRTEQGYGHGDFVVLGSTAYMCELRERIADGRTVVDAERFFEMSPVPSELVDLSGKEMLDFAREFSRSAAPGVFVVGVADWASDNRSELREQIRRQLVELGRDAKEKESAAKAAKQRRNALINRVLSWSDDADTDTAIGKLAGVSHTTVGTLRAAAEVDDDQDESVNGRVGVRSTAKRFRVGQQVRNKRTGETMTVGEPAAFDPFHYESVD